jgi:hypothetical protein
MNVTFGIMTTYSNIPQLVEVVESIQALNIRNAEIIIAGSYGETLAPPIEGAKHVLTHGWTPVKKNLVAKLAEYDTLCLLHDYFVFDPAWYNAWLAFNSHQPWDIALNPQYLINGKRHFTDWVIWDHPTIPTYTSLDYTNWDLTQHQYVSGGYFLVKRDLLRAHPFQEQMMPGSAEDVEWSLRVRHRGVMVCNPNAIVRHNKVHRDDDKKGFPYEQ